MCINAFTVVHPCDKRLTNSILSIRLNAADILCNTYIFVYYIIEKLPQSFINKCKCKCKCKALLLKSDICIYNVPYNDVDKSLKLIRLVFVNIMYEVLQDK